MPITKINNKFHESNGIERDIWSNVKITKAKIFYLMNWAKRVKPLKPKCVGIEFDYGFRVHIPIKKFNL